MTQTQPGPDVRSRTHAWADPRAWSSARDLTGLEVLRRMARGDLPPPPVAQLIGIDEVAVEPGRFTIWLVPAEFHYNPIGSVHGGVIATLLDTAAGCAVHSTLPAGVGYTSLDLHTRFVAPVVVGTGRVTCTGEVLHAGGRTATATARVEDATGRLLAHATSTCLLLRP